MRKFLPYPNSQPHVHPEQASLRPASRRRWIIVGMLALTLGMPVIEHSLITPAYAHHGGGGGGGGGGGKGDGIKPNKATTLRPAPADGQGKGGRGLEGLKP